MNAADPELAVTTAGFDELLRARLETEIEIYPARAWYPSRLGHPCDRFLVWQFTRWQQRARHSPERQAIFDEGRLHQPSIYGRLEQLGFELVRESDRPVQYRVGRATISGRPDGRIIAYRGIRYRPPILLEAKSMSDYQWQTIDSPRDMLASESPWTRAYFAQGHIGALLENTPRLAFALKNKQTGMLKLLPDELDYGYAESMLQRVERLQPMIEEQRDPAPLAYHPRICGGCDFEQICYPARSFGEGATVLDDPHLLEQLARRDQLAPGRREYEELDKTVKARLKREGVKYAVAGDFTIEGSVVSKKTYTVDAHDEIRFDIRRHAAASPSMPEHAAAPTLKEGDASSNTPTSAAASDADPTLRVSTTGSDGAPAAPPRGKKLRETQRHVASDATEIPAPAQPGLF